MGMNSTSPVLLRGGPGQRHQHHDLLKDTSGKAVAGAVKTREKPNRKMIGAFAKILMRSYK